MRPLLAAVLAGAIGVGLGVGGARVAGVLGGGATGDRAVRDALLAHPEIITEAMARLRANETAQAIAADRRAIETPFAGAWAGNPHGDVTLVMFTDYACGYCRASAPDIDRLLRDDPRLKVVWREIPVLGPPSEIAAHDALAAAEQGKYVPFHRALFVDARPDPAHLAAAARAAALDGARLAADRESVAVQRELDGNLALAQRLGVTGTPAFVVGDQMLTGAVGHDRLAAAVAAARAGA